MKIQSLAQAGLAYTQSEYDRERYRELREISAQILAHKSEVPVETVRDLFCNDEGYQTPKVDTRAAIIADDKILLVRENDGYWSLPGGWADILQSPASNTAKEAAEEAGIQVKVTKLVAVQDRNLHNTPVFPYSVWKLFFLCESEGGHFAKNIETTASAYFGLAELPPLSESKNTAAQIRMCFEAHRQGQGWQTLFD
ncbi:ADP-ribose pyrophosphatase [Actinomyces sp. HMSC06A08]|nr:ADP-ribose pyrophosphatase [Actinomyces sp. HMSC064C12]OFK00570.1 ADP-ribose pyrophosphatase [Actinomyces sp. HMSC072A03]OFT56841.1 ADP-ribose pyrophosphatase [Actinomyces sp. HMSC06A08]